MFQIAKSPPYLAEPGRLWQRRKPRANQLGRLSPVAPLVYEKESAVFGGQGRPGRAESLWLRGLARRRPDSPDGAASGQCATGRWLDVRAG